MRSLASGHFSGGCRAGQWGLVFRSLQEGEVLLTVVKHLLNHHGNAHLEDLLWFRDQMSNRKDPNCQNPFLIKHRKRQNEQIKVFFLSRS